MNSNNGLNDFEEEKIKIEVPILYEFPINGNTLLNLIVDNKTRSEVIELIKAIKKELIDDCEIPNKIIDSYFDNNTIFSLLQNDDHELELHFNFSYFLAYEMMYFTKSKPGGNNEFPFLQQLEFGKLNQNDMLQMVKTESRQCRSVINGINAMDLRAFVGKLLNEYSSAFTADYLGSNDFIQLANNFSMHDSQKISIIKQQMNDIITKVLVNNRALKDELFNEKFNALYSAMDIEMMKFDIYSNLLENIVLKNDDNNYIYSIINYYQKNEDNDDIRKKVILFRNKKYTFNDFEKNIQKYLLQHKEVNLERIDDGFFDNWSAEEVNEYLDEFEKETLKKFEVIDPNSVFFPPTKNENKNILINNDVYDKNKTKEESLLSLKKRQFYADHNDEIYQCLMGKDEFKGHIAMVLKNGYVIFEKYDVKDENFSTKNGAAYIMTINNFNKFSKKSLTEVREYIKNQDDGIINMDKITFRCHRGNWEEYISEYFDKDTGIDLNTIQIAVQSASENRHSRR